MALKKIKVFIADDHLMMLEGQRALLGQSGFEVVGEANSFAETLANCARGNPDVLILDLNMELENGIDGIDSILAKYPEAKIIVYSFREEISIIYAAYQHGVKAYVKKSSPIICLTNAIEQVVSGSNYYLPDVVDKIVRYNLGEEVEKSPEHILTGAELEVFIEMAKGKNKQEIADTLKLEVKTVNNRATKIKKKLGVEVATYAWLAKRHNLLRLDL